MINKIISVSSAVTLSVAVDSLRKKNTRDHDHFREQWRDDFPSLITDKEDSMFCSVCSDAKQINGFIEGSRNFQFSALKDHAYTKGHVSAVATLFRQPSMTVHSNAAVVAESDCLKGQLRTLLFMSQCHIASHHFDSLIELQKANGCSAFVTGDPYKSHESTADMEESLPHATKSEIKTKVENSQYLGGTEGYRFCFHQYRFT